MNTLRPRPYCKKFSGDIFKCIFSNDNCCIFFIKISLKVVLKGPINNNPTLVQGVGVKHYALLTKKYHNVRKLITIQVFRVGHTAIYHHCKAQIRHGLTYNTLTPKQIDHHFPYIISNAPSFREYMYLYFKRHLRQIDFEWSNTYL